MAAGWIRAIRAVPWSDVVAAAPMVLGSAKTVLAALQKKKESERGGAAAVPDDPQGRVLQQRVADLEADLVATTEVLRNLATQHAQLVAELEALRGQTRLLGWTSALLTAVALGLVLWLAWH
jgi:hypothetical protein